MLDHDYALRLLWRLWYMMCSTRTPKMEACVRKVKKAVKHHHPLHSEQNRDWTLACVRHGSMLHAWHLIERYVDFNGNIDDALLLLGEMESAMGISHATHVVLCLDIAYLHGVAALLVMQTITPNDTDHPAARQMIVVLREYLTTISFDPRHACTHPLLTVTAFS